MRKEDKKKEGDRVGRIAEGKRYGGRRRGRE